MNGKKAKKIRRHSKEMLFAWLRTVVEPEEASKITAANFEDYLPTQGYVFANRKLLVSAYSDRWFINKIKQKVTQENRDVETIRFDELPNDGRG